MAKKKVKDEEVVSQVPDPVPDAVAPQEAKQEEQPTTTSPSNPPQNGEAKRKPAVSYRLLSDRTTSLEVSVWSNELTNGDGEKWTRYSITAARSYKDQNGQWCKGGSYRIHDIPILLFLLGKAHAFALNMRTEDTSIPF